MRKMDLMVEDSINTMEWLLAEVDKYKLVSFDLAYVNCHVGHDLKVFVAQLCVHHHVLLYHYYLAIVPFECFTRFANSPDYRIAIVLKTSGLAWQKLVEIRNHYKI
ncbi:Serine/threonine-protein kinase [Hordeum vulgare]|nr:Serine/threonine-protein kinase [Hordeum vulgare]